MSRSALLVLAFAACVCGASACRTVPTPEGTAAEYAHALEEGRIDDAYALISSTQRKAGLSRDAFAARYQKVEARKARADAVEQAAGSLTARNGSVTLVREGEAWRVLEPVENDGPKKTLEAFVTAAEKGNFAAAYALLAGPLRARYTPERLEKDFRAEPLAKERLSRARAALAQEPELKGNDATFPVGAGKAVRLTLEADGYRVVSLE